MKFIISSFSWEMFNIPNITVDKFELTEEEFQMAIFDAFSHVGHEDIAQAINVAYNKEPVRARTGDILLLADWDNGTLVFYCIQVCPSETPLLRTDELEYTEYEEMI
jgi:hypothetical protein